MAHQDGGTPVKRHIRIFGRRVGMPQSRPLRIAIGVLLIIFGLLGFLPILGFWMVPLGVLVLSYEFSSVRRFRRRVALWWHRKRRRERRASRAARRGMRRTATPVTSADGLTGTVPPS